MNDSAKWLINSQANQARYAFACIGVAVPVIYRSRFYFPIIHRIDYLCYRNSSNSNNHVNHAQGNGNSTKIPTPVTMSPTSTTATTAASPTESSQTSATPATTGINPLLTSSLLAAKYLGQKRHSLTTVGHKLSLAVQQHRHSVELSSVYLHVSYDLSFHPIE